MRIPRTHHIDIPMILFIGVMAGYVLLLLFGCASAYAATVVEAENMTLRGYAIEDDTDWGVVSSGSRHITTKGQSSPHEARYTLPVAMRVDVKVFVWDEDDGESRLEVWRGPDILATFAFDGTAAGNAWERRGYVVPGVNFNAGDELILKSYPNASEYARIDYVELTLAGPQFEGTVLVEWDQEYTTTDGQPTDVLDYTAQYKQSGSTYRDVRTVFDDDSGHMSTGFNFPDELVAADGATVCFRVASRNEAGASDWSDEACKLVQIEPTLVTVPDVRGATLEQATAALESVGLVVGAVGEVEGEPVGYVASQQPAAGVEVAEGSAVDLTVNVAGEPVQVIPVPPKGLILKLIPVN